jgi:hypothetical protein
VDVSVSGGMFFSIAKDVGVLLPDVSLRVVQSVELEHFLVVIGSHRGSSM